MNLSMTKLKEQAVEPSKSAKSDENATKYILDILLRRNYDEVEDFIEVRVAVVGNVDAGKSTLLGVLTHGILGKTKPSQCLSLFV